MAPVGQASAAGRASRQEAKWNSGRERLLEYLEHGSAVRARIGEVETLVDYREIGDDVPLHRLYDGGPVIHRRVLDLTALQAIAGRRAHPMQDLAAPALHGAERAASGRHGSRRRAVRAFRQVVGRRAQDAERLLHLITS